MALFRCVGAMNAIAVNSARTNAGKIAVPDFFRKFWQVITMEFVGSGRIEDTQFNARGVCREERKVDALSIPGGAPGVRRTDTYFGLCENGGRLADSRSDPRQGFGGA
jgi:hypothetical protein